MTEQTLFVFCSDNGGPTRHAATNGPLRAGKGTLYEGGVRVAACAAWPGHIEAGGVVEEPMHIVDWYPTLLNLAGASLDQEHPLDGKDIQPVLTAGESSPHDDILLNTTPTGGALRAGDWKIVIRGDRSAVDTQQNTRKSPAKAELFNLSEDPAEQNNLAEQHPDKLRELRTRLNEYARSAVPPRNKPKAAGLSRARDLGGVNEIQSRRAGSAAIHLRLPWATRCFSHSRTTTPPPPCDSPEPHGEPDCSNRDQQHCQLYLDDISLLLIQKLAKLFIAIADFRCIEHPRDMSPHRGQVGPQPRENLARNALAVSE